MKIIENSKEHLNEFIRLNEEWISQYFEIEDADKKLASDPFKIVEDGGYIFYLILSDSIVGVCALFNNGSGAYIPIITDTLGIDLRVSWP